MKNFWQKLKKPFFCLAPMADVTDAAFRQIITKYGKPDVLWTEFVSADGLMLGGRDALIHDLKFEENERPIVAQLFSGNPEHMRDAAKLCAELGFDGIDINMGCPDSSIEKQGAGAAMIKNPDVAKKVIEAAKEGAPNLPISVKTRVGYSKVELETWIPFLLSQNLAALTVHARTRKEMSLVPANWDHVKRAVEIRNEMNVHTLIIGNGDVKDLQDAKEKVLQTGCDGVMLGRAIFGNPWLFDESKKDISIKEKLEVFVEHAYLFEKLLGGVKSFNIMKKHMKGYAHNFPGATELRTSIAETKTADELENVVHEFLSKQ